MASRKTRTHRWGSDHRRLAPPVVPSPISGTRLALGRLAIVATVVGWLAYFGTWLAGNFFNGQPLDTSNKAEAVVYLVIVTMLTSSSLAYLISRLGFFYRAREHHRVARVSIDEFFDRSMPTLTALVPSFQEEARVIRNTLLSAALQEYPYKRVVLLIDDPPAPRTRRHHEMLEAARALPRQIEELLAEPSARFATALEQFELSDHVEGRLAIEAMRELFTHYRYAARWLKDLADDQEIVDHTDAFFANEVLRRLAEELSRTADALAAATEEGAALSRERIVHFYRRLAWIFRAQVSSFERKRFASLSHEPNKAMNLNSYLGLMGGSFREIEGVAGRVLVPTAPGTSDLDVPDPDYVLTLDADSVLLPEYCLRLVYLLEQSEHSDVAVAQTPYSAFPGAATRLERVAGATTDIQHIAHQGLTFYDATFWVGANAVIRKRALDDIVRISYLGDWELRQYIRDKTVIEDTESTIDLAIHGWRLLNVTERLSYSATPPDFGSLCIQRRRWSNGGLLILPKLVSEWRSKRRRGTRMRFGELYLRANYMASIAWSSLGLLILLAFPFRATLISPLLGLVAVPYFLAMATDLRYCGYKRFDALRIYGFNLVLIPVNLAGSGASLIQAITATKGTFGRTPKIRSRTVAPFFFVVAPFLVLLLAVYTFQHAYRHQHWENAAFAGFNTLFGLYAIVAYIGIRNSIVDIWVHLKSVITKPTRPRRAERRRMKEQTVPAPATLDWLSILHLGASEPGHWPASGTATLIDRSLRRVGENGTVRNLAGMAEAGRHVARNGSHRSELDFKTVFQPVFDLRAQEIIGYEALTRFLDGAAPERRLAEAVTAGTGLELELALTQAALADAGTLPNGTWLGLNASSRALLNTPRFHSMIEEAGCPIVVELKEPTTIDADAELRQAAGGLPSNAFLGIQNIGLNHASLSIVTKLRPRFVKLDRAIIADLDTDLARQAQLSAMISLATSVSCEVIAMGIETEAELVCLRRLGVRLGQGFLLGRPNQLEPAGAYR
jgi:EAL domain-containing protein (putative c-di-GMP-specific phosphodiesterase class I)/cellulose synthase/poly-beta-1,6-N-acetylglucosamine synthase-like glycosyltransferase